MPCSSAVARFGSAGERLLSSMAMPLIVPPSSCDLIVVTTSQM